MNRIELLASLAKDSEVLLDVGCDHAYTVIKALKNYNVKKAIAADIAIGPLEVAKKNIASSGYINDIKIIQSDGLKDINDYFSTLIISGMGGLLIKDILSNDLEKIKNKKLILSPNRDFNVVREFLVQNHFKIVDEYSFYDKNSFYEVIVAEDGTSSISEFEIEYGPILLKKKDKDFIKYYEKKYNQLKMAYDKLSNEEERNRIKTSLDDYLKIIK